MWMDDLRRNMDRKAKADALPDEIRKAHRDQYRNVCRDAVKACIIGMAEVMTGKPQDRNAQLAECAGKIVDEWTRNCANGVIIRIVKRVRLHKTARIVQGVRIRTRTRRSTMLATRINCRRSILRSQVHAMHTRLHLQIIVRILRR